MDLEKLITDIKSTVEATVRDHFAGESTSIEADARAELAKLVADAAGALNTVAEKLAAVGAPPVDPATGAVEVAEPVAPKSPEVGGQPASS